MLRGISGLGSAFDEALASLSPAVNDAARRAHAELAARGRLRTDAPAPALELPSTFASMLAAALALEGARPRENRADVLRMHYLELMPRAHVEQLSCTGEPHATVLHARLDWGRVPRVRGALDRLDALARECGVAPALAYGADSPEDFFAARPTVASLYRRTHFGALMPLLYCSPADLRAMQRALEAGVDAEAIVDRHLAAPLAHELSHAGRHRDALFPPYLDECVAAFVGVRVLPDFAIPRDGERHAIYATPWFEQVGRALVRACGLVPVIQAHCGARAWADALPPGLAHALARLGWHEYERGRHVHFLASHVRPDPWMKLFFLAAAGDDPARWTLDALETHPWSRVPCGEPEPEDERLLRDALEAMCLHNVLEDGTFRVERRLPRGPITLDAERGRVTRARLPDEADTVDPSYLLAPAIAKGLRSRGLARSEVVLDSWDAIAAAASATAPGA